MSSNLLISICIPQYNRIGYLLKSLEIIEKQTYHHIEIIISDDCSTDETEIKVKELVPNYRYPIKYHKNSYNRGYDYNYRNCIALANGDYAFVIGNDDSIYGSDSIEYLVNFLNENDLPDLGYCNIYEESSGGTVIRRALSTKVIGNGAEIAMKNYSCFSFVGGLIYKKSTFDLYNTDKYDGSIFAQMYLGVYMIIKGVMLFSIERPLVLKDIVIENEKRNSYTDTIAKSWKTFKIVDGGIPSVINVLICALNDSNSISQDRVYAIFKRIYLVTFPHWVLDYKENQALPEAVGLIFGLFPWKNQNIKKLNFVNRTKIYIFYYFASFISLITPVFLYKKLKQKIYSFLKK